MPKPLRQAFFTMGPGARLEELWTENVQRHAEVCGIDVRLNPHPGKLSTDQWANLLGNAEMLITSWGAPALNSEVLRHNNALKIVGHAAGSVANIVTDDLYERGVRVVSANAVMARAVAEWSLMMSLVGTRNLSAHAKLAAGQCPNTAARNQTRGLNECVVGIWGYGDVARALLALLQPFKPRRILVCDPFAIPTEAERGGFECVTIETLFSRSDVVHLLTGLTPETKGRVGADLLGRLRRNSVLINAGRAPLVDQEALLEALRRERFSAILDVHYREPVPPDDPFVALANVIMTPHCAGRPGRECYVPCILDEFVRFREGKPLNHEISRSRAAAMTDSSLLRT